MSCIPCQVSDYSSCGIQGTYAALYISYMHPVHCAVLNTLSAYCASSCPEARLLKKVLVLATGDVASTLGRQFSAVPLLSTLAMICDTVILILTIAPYTQASYSSSSSLLRLLEEPGRDRLPVPRNSARAAGMRPICRDRYSQGIGMPCRGIASIDR
jgi:hypothetical protein